MAFFHPQGPRCLHTLCLELSDLQRHLPSHDSPTQRVIQTVKQQGSEEEGAELSTTLQHYKIPKRDQYQRHKEPNKLRRGSAVVENSVPKETMHSSSNNVNLRTVKKNTTHTGKLKHWSNNLTMWLKREGSAHGGLRDRASKISSQAVHNSTPEPVNDFTFDNHYTMSITNGGVKNSLNKCPPTRLTKVITITK
jgi:hypothetical protein